jgi:hypothetical protein
MANEKWSVWKPLGSIEGFMRGFPPEGKQYRPAISSWGANRLDVFVGLYLDNIQHKYWDGTKWSDWEELEAKVSYSPSAVSWGKDRIDIFAKTATTGDMDRCYHISWDSRTGWSGWNGQANLRVNIPWFGHKARSPAACARGINVLDLFVVGSGGRGRDEPHIRSDAFPLWHMQWNGTLWSEAEFLKGELTSSPSAVSWGPHRIDVVAFGKDNQLWHIHWG